MLLTSKELKDIITKYGDENVQQNGIDLNLIKVEKMVNKGIIPKKGKTVLPVYEEVGTVLFDNKPYWDLEAGVYNITTEQGCNIPDNVGFEIFQRSSLLRCGVIIRSSWFDPGFKTENIGTVMVVLNPVMIEFGARVGQVIANESNPTKMYDGQFQNDQQRLV